MAYEHELLGKAISWNDGEAERTGVAWSAGPLRGTAWVIPDGRAEGEGAAVCVRVSRSKGHTVTESDRRRSTARIQAEGLAALRVRQIVPPVLYKGPDGLGTYGYHLPRGA